MDGHARGFGFLVLGVVIIIIGLLIQWDVLGWILNIVGWIMAFFGVLTAIAGIIRMFHGEEGDTTAGFGILVGGGAIIVVGLLIQWDVLGWLLNIIGWLTVLSGVITVIRGIIAMATARGSG